MYLFISPMQSHQTYGARELQHLGVLLHRARTPRARCGTFLIFLEILPGGEAHRKPLWRVFPNAWGWSPHAFG